MTVIIAAWRAAASLPRAVASCLTQEDVDIEVIVVDDASPDDTAQIASALSAEDSRIRVIVQDENGGPGAARNTGIAAATGDWIAVLDADDAMVPDRLSKMVRFGDANDADAVYDNLAIVKAGDAGPSGTAYLDSATFAAPAEWDAAFFIAHNQARPGRPSLGYLKPVLRRSFVDAHNLRYLSALRNGEDFHLMLDALHCGAKLWYMPDAMYLYTTGAESISSTLNLDHARNLIAATSEFIEEKGDALSVEARQHLAVRHRRLVDFAIAETAMRAVKEKRFGTAATSLFTKPGALFRFCQQLCQALAKRLR